MSFYLASDRVSLQHAEGHILCQAELGIPMRQRDHAEPFQRAKKSLKPWRRTISSHVGTRFVEEALIAKDDDQEGGAAIEASQFVAEGAAEDKAYVGYLRNINMRLAVS